MGSLQVGASAKTITPTCFEQDGMTDGNNRYASNIDVALIAVVINCVPETKDTLHPMKERLTVPLMRSGSLATTRQDRFYGS